MGVILACDGLHEPLLNKRESISHNLINDFRRLSRLLSRLVCQSIHWSVHISCLEHDSGDHTFICISVDLRQTSTTRTTFKTRLTLLFPGRALSGFGSAKGGEVPLYSSLPTALSARAKINFSQTPSFKTNKKESHQVAIESEENTDSKWFSLFCFGRVKLGRGCGVGLGVDGKGRCCCCCIAKCKKCFDGK